MIEQSKIYFFEVDSLNLRIFILEVKENMPDLEIVKISENTKSTKNTESVEDVDVVEIYNRIHQYVVVEKHFLDKNITIKIIMRHCDVHKKSLNKILRLNDNIAFHGYINKQRVIYASSLLLDSSNKLIEVVALEACFNNTRTFVRNFKVVYNMTPSEYRRRYGEINF